LLEHAEGFEIPSSVELASRGLSKLVSSVVTMKLYAKEEVERLKQPADIDPLTGRVFAGGTAKSAAAASLLSKQQPGLSKAAGVFRKTADGCAVGMDAGDGASRRSGGLKPNGTPQVDAAATGLLATNSSGIHTSTSLHSSAGAPEALAAAGRAMNAMLGSPPARKCAPAAAVLAAASRAAESSSTAPTSSTNAVPLHGANGASSGVHAALVPAVTLPPPGIGAPGATAPPSRSVDGVVDAANARVVAARAAARQHRGAEMTDEGESSPELMLRLLDEVENLLADTLVFIPKKPEDSAAKTSEAPAAPPKMLGALESAKKLASTFRPPSKKPAPQRSATADGESVGGSDMTC